MVNLAQKEKDIDGVIFTPLKIISVADGDILHGMKISEEGYQGFGEAYFSTVDQGGIKAWKKHTIMYCNLVVIEGKVKFNLFDDRQTSQTQNQNMALSLSRNNYARLTIPPNIWFGFKGLGQNNVILNMASLIYDPEEVINLPLNNTIIANVDW